MIFKLQEQLVQLFISDKTSEVEDISALNVAAMRLRELPYFAGAFPDHFLVDRGNGFYQLHHTSRTDVNNADPLQNIYHDEYAHYYSDEDEDVGPSPDYFPVRYPDTDRRPITRREVDIPPSIETKARQYLDRLLEISPLMQLASNPSAEDLKQKFDFQVKLMNYDELYQFGRDLLGDHYQPSLKEHGIRYHNMDGHSWHGDIYRYAIVHNQHEIVGVADLHHKKSSLGVCGVSTAHGFRGRGVSYLLYSRLIDYAKEHGLIVERSSPAGDAYDNPLITAAYDRVLENASVLHVSTNTYLTKALYAALEQHSYEDVLAMGKDTCDRLMKNARNTTISSYEREAFDKTETQKFKVLAGLEAAPASLPSEQTDAEEQAPAPSSKRRRP